jgi:Raf kinase inhibitor-like YbhB/YbcL family protein
MNRLLIALCCLGLGARNAPAQSPKLTVASTAFEPGQPIPIKYTCQGDDISPPLTWDGAPANTVTFALICDDPDAPGGTWVHWVIYNLPPRPPSLPENTPKTETLPNGDAQGRNSFGNIGYGGPCPPAGKTHHYIFKVYALDAALTVKSHPGKDQLLAAMRGHILAEGQLMGTYKRQ